MYVNMLVSVILIKWMMKTGWIPVCWRSPMFQVVYDWLAPGWGWANPGTITQRGFHVPSCLWTSATPGENSWHD
jgi:hypothetical protein